MPPAADGVRAWSVRPRPGRGRPNGAGQNGAGQNSVGQNGRPERPAERPAVPAAGPALAWPGTRPLAVRSKDDFADLLPPVSYAAAAPVASQGGPAASGRQERPRQAAALPVRAPSPPARRRPGCCW